MVFMFFASAHRVNARGGGPPLPRDPRRQIHPRDTEQHDDDDADHDEAKPPEQERLAEPAKGAVAGNLPDRCDCPSETPAARPGGPARLTPWHARHRLSWSTLSRVAVVGILWPKIWPQQKDPTY
jgi:hypothetical protein